MPPRSPRPHRTTRLHAAWLCLFALLGSATLAFAQPYYPGLVRGTPVVLAPGVTWQTISHANPAWQIQVFEVDMSNRNVELMPVFKAAGNVSGSANETTSTLAQRVGAIAAINAGYFTTDGTRLTNSYTLIDGQFIGGSGVNMRPENNRSAIGFSANHQALAIRSKLSSSFAAIETNQWSQIVDAMAGRGHFRSSGGTLLVVDNENTTTDHHASRHPRTALGFSLSPYRAFMVTVDGRTSVSVGMTYQELGQLMADLGIEESISLDGGGSTTAWVQGRGVVNVFSDASERTVVSAWAVVPANTMDNVTDEVTFSGTWSTQAVPSLNLHYSGDHRIAENASGPASATWRPVLNRTGHYRVYAWWVAASARSATAPFTVTHALGTDTVSVDQRADGSRWNLLGTFAFREGDTGTVTLANSSPGSVSADAVRFVYQGPADALTWQPTPWRELARDDAGATPGAFSDRPVLRIPQDSAPGDSQWQRDFNLAATATPPIATPPGSDGRVLRTSANNAAPGVAQLVYQLHGAAGSADQAIEAWVLGYLGSDNSSGPTTWGGLGVRMDPLFRDGYFAQHRVDSTASLGSYLNFYRVRSGVQTLLGRYYYQVGTGGAVQGTLGDSRLVRSTPAVATNQWVHLRLEAVGDTIALFIDNPALPVAVFRDPEPITNGSVALFHEDAFAGTVTTPAGSSGTWFESIRIELPRPPLPLGWSPLITAIEALGGGGVRARLQAPAGQPFTIEASSDLRLWSPLPGSWQADPDGTLTIEDASATTPSRMWRLTPQ